jgi:hypothetical protein
MKISRTKLAFLRLVYGFKITDEIYQNKTGDVFFLAIIMKIINFN